MTADCQVDFYVLQNEGASAERLVCRLALMAWEKGNTIQIVAEDRPQLQALDELLWQYPAGRFIPHFIRPRGMKEEPPPAPVELGLASDFSAEDTSVEVIINLDRRPVAEPLRHARILEIVPADGERRSASREKFRAYRKLGLDPRSHDMRKSQE